MALRESLPVPEGVALTQALREAEREALSEAHTVGVPESQPQGAAEARSLAVAHWLGEGEGVALTVPQVVAAGESVTQAEVVTLAVPLPPRPPAPTEGETEGLGEAAPTPPPPGAPPWLGECEALTEIEAQTATD